MEINNTGVKLFNLTGLTFDELQMITTSVEEMPLNSRASVVRAGLCMKIQDQYSAAINPAPIPDDEQSVNLPGVDADGAQ